MLLKNTSAHCAPTAPSAKAASTGTMLEASAGLPNHSSADPASSSAENPAIHGLRWPAASAIAPSAGDNNAMISPAAAVANPHSAWPRVASPTIEAAKYGAYTKVVIRVKNGCTAHSNRIQPAIAAGLASPACARLANLAASEPQATPSPRRGEGWGVGGPV